MKASTACIWSIVAPQSNACKTHSYYLVGWGLNIMPGPRPNTNEYAFIILFFFVCTRYPDLVCGTVPVTPEAKLRGVMCSIGNTQPPSTNQDVHRQQSGLVRSYSLMLLPNVNQRCNDKI